MNIKAIYRLIKAVFTKVARSIELARYDDFNIAEFFRKQGAQIGENNRIEVRHLSQEPFLIRIGNHCTIGPSVVFLNHDGGVWLFSEEDPSLQKFGTIEILDNCFIGLGVIILGNVTIGPNSIVGAGSIVSKNVPPNMVVAGIPARVICSVDEYKEKVIRQWKTLKPPGYFQGLGKGVKLSPREIQRLKSRDHLLLKEHLIKTLWLPHPGK